MRVQAYLRVLSSETEIRALHSETKIPDASIEKTKASRNTSDGDVWWNWCTQRVPIDIDNIDDGLRTLLLAYKPIFLIIKKHQGPETDTYLEVITQYEAGEEPRGLCLSADTVALLGAMGCAFDNDVYSGVI